MKVRSREEWGAGPNGRKQVVPGVPGSGARGALVDADLQGITLHHVGSDGDLLAMTEAQIIAWLKRTQREHRKKADDWADIGYNYVVSSDGTMWEGCGWVRGAHAGSGEGNRETVGILVLKGDDEEMTNAQIAAVRKFRAENVMSKNRRADKVFPHKHWTNTECPGNVVSDIPAIIAKPKPKPKVKQYAITLPGKGELRADLYRQPKRGPIARRLKSGHKFGGVGVVGNYIKTSGGLYVHRKFAKEVK